MIGWGMFSEPLAIARVFNAQRGHANAGLVSAVEIEHDSAGVARLGESAEEERYGSEPGTSSSSEPKHGHAH